MQRVPGPLLLLVAVPAIGSLLPALVWLGVQGHSEKVVIGATMASLLATGRIAMRVLDRLGVNGMWARLKWVIAAIIVGLTVWGVVLSAGGAYYETLN
ncbi:MAG TPA: hypothetical protein VF927_02520 [Solirubrobacteraceae bacterium]